MKVLSLNPGSSSLKFALYEVSPQGETSLIRGLYDRLGTPNAVCTYSRLDGSSAETPAGSLDLTEAVNQAIGLCNKDSEVEAVGCRVVHGGELFRNPVVVSDHEIAQIQTLAPLAPLHNSRDVAAIQASRLKLSSHPVVAVFDTGFHQTLPPCAYLYAIPGEVTRSMGIRRYGFHGISYAHSVRALQNASHPFPKRLVICHLGSGASMCAVLDGKSIDTSMGFTPLEGLMMGTRSGDVDPGVLLYLMRERGYSVQAVDEFLNRESGLLGVSGLSADLRDLEQAAIDGNKDAELAIALFTYRIVKYIGAYAAALGGLDGIVFTGGIGEHSPSVRQRVCAQLNFLGVSLSPEKNSSRTKSDLAQIDGGGPVRVWVIKADEERQIARETFQTL